MGSYCDVCDKFIKPKSKNKHFKSNTHKKFNKSKHIELTKENPDINNVDEVFNAYILQHKKRCECYPIKCHFKKVFSDNQYRTNFKSSLFDNKTTVPLKIFLEKVSDDFKQKGYNFNHIEEMKIITIANKMNMSYDFSIKHNMHMIEWKLNAMINKDKKLINKFYQNWRHPINRKFESYRI